jgi:hypothetical protein
MDRKSFITTLGLSLALSPLTSFLPPYKNKNRFFTIKRDGKHYFLIDPDEHKFFSIGINHIDAAPLRYVENATLWKDKYGNSIEKWLTTNVRPNLVTWGFNTLGWNQEVVTRNLKNHRHSRGFTPEEYRWLNMPYCHMLHFADFHQWEAETINPDFFSTDFSDWCDYIARDEAARMADDQNLIGYFYIDCPTWIHTTQYNEWKGPLFDPEKLKSEAGKKELFRIASRYYKVTNEAIRRYDRNHMIFGDRYEAARPLAEEVIKAALPYIDALCFQHFAPPEKIVANLNYWHSFTGLPTLVADCCHQIRDEITGYMKHSPDGYPEIYRLLRETPSCIGFHLCGAYLETDAAKEGF